ncbi:MAG: MBL fold metallo-hydrolase [Candidatus Aenigmarchaeota archaeon]|nr:MBL fold metallo-hydrolase [Candidatus Aenigmarchaeota archaeon]
MLIYKNIHLLQGIDEDCNVYVIDGEVMIDAGTGKFFPEMKGEMEKTDTSALKSIINTHYHFDHTGGSKKFRDWLGAEICIHSKDREYMENGNTLAEMFGEKPRITTVDSVLKEKGVIKTKNFRFEILHTPGHTPGSVCLYEREKCILISGDTIFEGNFGRTDLPGGSMEDMMKSLKKLSELKVSYLFPGHGSIKIGGIGFVIKQAMALKQKSSTV